MPARGNLDALRELQAEIETFLRSLRHPIVVEDEVELFDLTAASWRLSADFGKLLFEAWNPARSLVRRIEEVAYRDRSRLGLFVRQPGGRATGTLELRELERAERPARAAARSGFRHELLAVLQREYPGWRFEHVSNRSDREHSFSAWYTRGLARRGSTAWAFLGLSEGEAPAAADAVLAFALIWLDWLRGQSERYTVSGLKLFLPHAAVELTAHRAAYLEHRALQVELFEWNPGEKELKAVDLKDFGNVETRLTPRRQGEALVERHQELVRDLLGELAPRVDAIPDTSANFLSLRVLGLEVARVEGVLAPRVFYGLEGSYRRLASGEEVQLRRFVSRVLELRRADSEDLAHDFYRLQAERWLESLLVRDITRLDPALVPEYVYPQVPAFSGGDRGVIDILSVTRQGRLAVIELKLEEEIKLPLQGLDYWLRVKWLHERGQFQEFGYFLGVELASAAPLVYLVSPAFRFHSTTDRMIRYLDRSIEVVKVGLNDRWREGVKVLFRQPAGTSL
jgi:transposase